MIHRTCHLMSPCLQWWCTFSISRKHSSYHRFASRIAVSNERAGCSCVVPDVSVVPVIWALGVKEATPVARWMTTNVRSTPQFSILPIEDMNFPELSLSEGSHVTIATCTMGCACSRTHLTFPVQRN